MGLTFVEHQELAAPDHRARERDDLPLSDREVAACARDLRVQRQTRFAGVFLQCE